MIQYISSMIISGIICDPLNRVFIPGNLCIENGKILSVLHNPNVTGPFILPGFVDAHIHIESSMLIPSEFAKMALRHGTVATVSDPHEIANVCGLEGVRYMIDNAAHSGMKIYFGAPSCVPATSFESAGAVLNSDSIAELVNWPEIKYLSEVMNYPGVIHRDPDLIKKIQIALDNNLPVDGHAPGVTGSDLKQYVNAGISTDHECVTLDEALEKISLGMKILIRQGSAARNFDALHNVLASHPDKSMFCTDDCHPDDLEVGHLNLIVKKALSLGYDFWDVLAAATVNPIDHYKLNVGLLQPGDPADFIMVDSLESFNILSTWVDGQQRWDGSQVFTNPDQPSIINSFSRTLTKISDYQIPCASAEAKINVIQALDGSLLTKRMIVNGKINKELLVSDTESDVLKIAVVNRYSEQPVALGFIHGFGLKIGALASSVAHDSHNIVCVGVDDFSMMSAVNLVIKEKGGISCVTDNEQGVLALPVAGLMSTESGEYVANRYKKLNELAAVAGSGLRAPFMTLSFMALLVIPEFKIGDKGLFDGANFTPDSLFVTL